MIPLPNTIAPFINHLNRIMSPWIQYLQQFTQAPPNFVDVTVSASPFTYEAKEPGNIYISGGTVSSIVLTRGSNSITVTGSLIPVGIKDLVTVTYSVLPTMKFIPSFGQNTG